MREVIFHLKTTAAVVKEVSIDVAAALILSELESIFHGKKSKEGH